MKHTLLSICLLVAGVLSAQTDLYVGNTGTYIYVDGTSFAASGSNVPLYVTNNIQLDGANSHLYLRNEAQLLQGSTATGNSGTGQLSVYQAGTVNQYAYNYWCPPVGNTDANNSTNRPFRANNNIYDNIGHANPALATITSALATYTTGWDGTPTVPLTTPQVISSRWLYSYDPGTLYSEWDHIAETGAIGPGYGFTMKGNSSGGQNYDFRGKPNTGNISVSVVAGEETLVGNPYPSALDALLFIHDPLNAGLTTGVLKYWEHDQTVSSHMIFDYVGGYALYTISSGGVESFTAAPFHTYLSGGDDGGPTGNNGSKIARRYIPIGQGFMIEGVSTGNVTYTNAQRVYYKQSGADSYFFRSNNSDTQATTVVETEYNEYGLNIVPEDFKRFRINVDFVDVESYTRQLLMNFHHTATDGFDYGLEAKGKLSEHSDAHWVLDNDPYFIQAFDFNTELRIPLVVNAKHDQPLRFRIFDIQNFDESQPIYIHDIHANLYVDLRAQNYEINLPAGNYTDRFEITFSQEALAVPDIAVSDFDVFQDNVQSQLTVLNPKNINIKNVRLFDTAGKMVFGSLPLGNAPAYHFPTKTLSEGVYVATITLSDNHVISKKVIVKN